MTEKKLDWPVWPTVMLSVTVGLVAAAILRILIFAPQCIDKCHGAVLVEAEGLCWCQEPVHRYD